MKPADPLDSSDAPRPPVYQQIARVLRSRVFHGLYAPDSLIPSENQLRREFGVARLTVRKAIQELRRDGVLVSRRGSGTYVAPDLRLVQPVRFTGYLEDLILQSLTLETVVGAVRTVTAPLRVRKAYGLPSGAKVLRLARTRYSEGVPTHHIVNYLLPDLVRGLPFEELSAGRSLTEFLSSEAGVETTSATQEFTAVAADDSVARALRVRRGAPLLYVETIGYNDNEVVNFTSGHYRPERTFFTATLTTVGSDTRIAVSTPSVTDGDSSRGRRSILNDDRADRTRLY